MLLWLVFVAGSADWLDELSYGEPKACLRRLDGDG